VTRPQFGDIRGTLDLRDHALRELEVVGGDERAAIASGPDSLRAAVVGEFLGRDPGDRRSDAEALLEGFRREGSDVFDRWNGEYAALVWDPRSRLLHLARDAAGALPFYWFRTGERIEFATSLALLEALPDFPRRVDPQGLGEFLFFLYVVPPVTIYRDTFQVPPGACVTLRGEAPEIRGIPDYEEGREPMGMDDAVAALLPVAREAVARCVARERENVVTLSGGIDSTLIACLARETGARVRCVTARYADARHDESRHAAAIAAHLGLPHRIVDLDEGHLAAELPRYFDVFEEPFGDPAALATLALARAGGLGDAVVLDGSGVDGVMGELPPRAARRAAPIDPFLPAPLRRAAARLLERLPSAGLRNLGRDLDYERFADLLVQWNGWRRDILPDGFRVEASHWWRIYERWHERTDLFGLYARLCAGAWGPCAVVPKSSRVGRALHLNFRYPFEDRDFGAAARSLPRSVRFDGRRNKVVLRKILDGFLPSELTDRPKHAFTQPLDRVLRHRNAEWVARYADPETIRRQGLLDPDPVRRSVERFLAGDTGETIRIWALVLTGLFLERKGIA